MKIGIYSPEWLISSHNTDFKIVKSFMGLEKFTDDIFFNVATKRYTFSYNLNKALQRLRLQSLNIVSHGIDISGEVCDLIYHYSQPINPEPFFRVAGNIPVMVTTGFMTDKYIIEKFGYLIDRQKEADVIAKNLERAKMIHFHTEGGRQRFLNFRPEFTDKTVAIPFFLPSLPLFINSDTANKTQNKEINILFVGNEGIRKGLQELIDALDLIGTHYLKSNNVTVTIISKDKPNSKNKISMNWHSKLPHAEIIKLMQISSIFVLIPKRESYGLVLVEAMAAGCAIISDNDETRKEILDDAAILLPTSNINLLAQSIKNLVDDQNLRRTLANKAKDRATKYFLPKIVATQYSECFRSIVNNK